MPESVEKVLLIILGWAFGIFSPILVQAISSRREVDAIKASVISELDELCYQVLGAVFLIDLRARNTSKEDMRWQLSLFESYSEKPLVENAIKYLRQAIQCEGDQLKEVMDKFDGESKKGLALKKHHAPLIEANFPKFQYLKKDMQCRLLEINLRINILNQIVDEYNFFYQATFREANFGPGYDGVLRNIDKALDAFRSQAVLVIEGVLSLKASLDLK